MIEAILADCIHNWINKKKEEYYKKKNNDEQKLFSIEGEI